MYFFQELDRLTQSFIDIFKAKWGDIGLKQIKIMQQTVHRKTKQKGGKRDKRQAGR